jgi:hypothetical protein
LGSELGVVDLVLDLPKSETAAEGKRGRIGKTNILEKRIDVGEQLSLEGLAALFLAVGEDGSKGRKTGFPKSADVSDGISSGDALTGKDVDRNSRGH